MLFNLIAFLSNEFKKGSLVFRRNEILLNRSCCSLTVNIICLVIFEAVQCTPCSLVYTYMWTDANSVTEHIKYTPHCVIYKL